VTGGLDLAGGYYRDVVAPLLDAYRPGLPHAAARLGSGSEVLGLDDELSRDHDWGPRLTLLVEADDVDGVASHLAARLPAAYAGLPTRFAVSRDPVARSRVEVDTAERFVASRLGLDAAAGLTAVEWLALTGQSILEVTAGAVFADTVGTLTRLRAALAWYPAPVWRYVVASDWCRLAQELPLMGRAGRRGDDAGSRVLAGRLAGVAMHLAFLLARRWPPYPKWLGTALAALPIAAALRPPLTAALAAGDWRERQEALAGSLAVLHQAQRGVGLPTSHGAPTEPFFDRPFLVVRPEVATLLAADLTDPAVLALPPGIGSVEQWSDSVDVLSEPARRVAATRGVFAGFAPTA
jgi:hypothetical protein